MKIGGKKLKLSGIHTDPDINIFNIDVFYIDRRKLKKLSRLYYVVPILKGKRYKFHDKNGLVFGDFDNLLLKGVYYSPMYVDTVELWELANINHFNHFKTIYLYKIFESESEYLKWKLKI